MADWRVPGMAIAIVQGDDVIYKKAFGVKEIGKPDPVTTDTVFQIGSASKAFTAALIAYMVDEGKARWNDRVVSHIKDFRLYDEWVTGQFTVTDLMAQRSGMVEHALDSLIMLGYDPGRVVSSLRYVKPATSFRSSYAYQNNLWLVAARIVEKLTGKGWAENVRDLIFRRLGMSSSSCDKRSFVTAADAATLHHIVDGKIIVLPMGWKYMDWVYDYGPAGGINSNLDDMAKWVRMHLSDGLFDGRRIINEESVRYMRYPQTVISGSSDPAQYYCQGWVHREADPYPVIWHNGGTSGSKTIVAFVPQAKVGIVVLSNLNETKLPESLAFRFFDMYFGNPERDWSKEAFDKDAKAAEKAASEEPVRPKLPLHARPLYKYCGEYANDIFGKVRVSKKGEEIALVIGPKDTAIGLSQIGRASCRERV